MIIRFNGSGWLFPFTMGVAKYIQKHKHHQVTKYAGISAGSFIASMVILDVDMDKLLEETIEDYQKCKCNPFLIKSCLLKFLDQYIPDDVTGGGVGQD